MTKYLLVQIQIQPTAISATSIVKMATNLWFIDIFLCLFQQHVFIKYSLKYLTFLSKTLMIKWVCYHKNITRDKLRLCYSTNSVTCISIYLQWEVTSVWYQLCCYLDQVVYPSQVMPFILTDAGAHFSINIRIRKSMSSHKVITLAPSKRPRKPPTSPTM